MISPNEPLSIDPTHFSPAERAELSERLKTLKGETPWEDLLFRRTEAQLLDLAMEQIRARRQAEPTRRHAHTAMLAQLKAQKLELFARMNATVAQQKAESRNG